VSLGDRGRASRAPRAEDDEEAFGADGSDADADAVFAPSEEEVERAMRAWRLRRAGADADAAAAATAAAEARARKEAVAQEVGPVWNALARDFTERQFTEALFSATPGDAPELEAGRGEGSSAEGRRELFAKKRKTSEHSRRFSARKPCCALSAAITRTSRLCALRSEICPRRRACTVGWMRSARFCTWERRRTCARERAGTSPRRCSARPRGTAVYFPKRAASTPCSPPGANATRFYWKRA
jgi:hypothetical protein